MQFKLVWDAKLRRYVSEGEDCGVRERSLEDVGTRYEHLADLRDIWQAGIDTVEHIKPEWRSVGDVLLAKNLEAAVELVNKQIDVMSKFDLKQYDLRKMMDSIPEVAVGEYEKTLPPKESQ